MQAPFASVINGRATTMNGRSVNTSAAETIRVLITDGSADPAHVSCTMVDPITGIGVVGVNSTVAVLNSLSVSIPWSSMPLDSALGITALFSSTTGYATGSEWFIFVASGGAVTTVPQPSSPLVAVMTAATICASTHTIIIDGGGSRCTFSWSSTVLGVTTRGVQVPILPYWVGNAELPNGIFLRFFSVTGFRIGTQWGISIVASALQSDFTLSLTASPLTVLNAIASGSTVSSYYFVRIVSCATGSIDQFTGLAVDQFEVSNAGSPYVGTYDIVSPSIPLGNVELGNGISIHFAANSGYAPGQLWTVKTSASQVAVSSSPSTREFAMCSNRGVCDTATGECNCANGYAGGDCSTLAAVSTSHNGMPALVLERTGLFSGTLLELATSRAAAPDFNFVTASAAGIPVFSITGDGTVSASGTIESEYLTAVGGATLGAALTVLAGGIDVVGGGITIAEGGADIAEFRNTNVLRIASEYPHVSGYGAAVLRLETAASSSAGFDFIEAVANGVTVFRVDGTGDIYLGANDAIRISADGFVQTKSNSALDIESAAAQTVILRAGGSSSTAVAGSLSLAGGLGTGGFGGGSVTIAGGASALGGSGGNIALIPGTGALPGEIILFDGDPMASATAVLTITGNTGMAKVSQLNVSGTATLASTLAVLGTTTLQTLNVAGSATLTSLQVSGIAILTNANANNINTNTLTSHTTSTYSLDVTHGTVAAGGTILSGGVSTTGGVVSLMSGAALDALIATADNAGGAVGNVHVQAGAGLSGGSVIVSTGATAGSLTLTSATSASLATGSTISMIAGTTATLTAGVSSGLTLTGGTSGVTISTPGAAGSTGSISIEAGASTSGTGGSVFLSPGTGTTEGHVIVYDGVIGGSTAVITVAGGSGTASLSALAVTGTSSLASLSVAGAGSLVSVTVSGSSSLTTLAVSGSSSLTTLAVSGSSSLASITVSGSSSLMTLAVSGSSSLTTLAVSGSSSLTTLAVSGSSSLASITVSGSSSLTTLAVSGSSSLTTLAVSGSSSLSSITASGASSLTTLAVSGSSSLTTLAVSGSSSLASLAVSTGAAVAGGTILSGGLSTTGGVVSLVSGAALDALLVTADNAGGAVGNVHVQAGAGLSGGSVIVSTGATAGSLTLTSATSASLATGSSISMIAGTTATLTAGVSSGLTLTGGTSGVTISTPGAAGSTGSISIVSGVSASGIAGSVFVSPGTGISNGTVVVYDGVIGGSTAVITVSGGSGTVLLSALAVTGSASLSTLAVSGASSLASLGVSGGSTFSSVTISGVATFQSSLVTLQYAAVNNGITVAGASSFATIAAASVAASTFVTTSQLGLGAVQSVSLSPFKVDLSTGSVFKVIAGTTVPTVATSLGFQYFTLIGTFGMVQTVPASPSPNPLPIVYPSGKTSGFCSGSNYCSVQMYWDGTLFYTLSVTQFAVLPALT